MARSSPLLQGTRATPTSKTTLLGSVNSSSCAVYRGTLTNPNAVPVWVQFFNNASPTLGTGYLTQIQVPSFSTTLFHLGGLVFSTALAIGAATSSGGSTAPGSAVTIVVAISGASAAPPPSAPAFIFTKASNSMYLGTF